MNRREMLTLSSSALAAAIACSKVSSPTSPELPPQKPQAPSPASSSVVIDTRKVGERKFSVTSPATGNLYYDVFRKSHHWLLEHGVTIAIECPERSSTVSQLWL